MVQSVGGIINLSKMLVNAINETKEQEKKYLENPRCKKPTFSNAKYPLTELAESIGLEPPTDDEIELLCRRAW